MRLMSFALTTDQIRNRTKTVTRRLGWKSLKPGSLICACKKAMGIPKGQSPERLAYLVVTDVRQVWLDDTTDAEAVREGFPHMSGDEFAGMFSHHMDCSPESQVTRIEFRYIPGGAL